MTGQPKPKSHKKPFAVPTRQNFDAEFNTANAADNGKQKNVRKGLDNDAEYVVFQEREGNGLVMNDAWNTAIHKVGLELTRGAPSAIAHLMVQNDAERTTYQLSGSADGTVTISLLGPDENVLHSKIITDIAARAGISAAGIRLLQKQVAQDGEVKGIEIAQIGGLVQKAKDLARFYY